MNHYIIIILLFDDLVTVLPTKTMLLFLRQCPRLPVVPCLCGCVRVCLRLCCVGAAQCSQAQQIINIRGNVMNCEVANGEIRGNALHWGFPWQLRDQQLVKGNRLTGGAALLT